MGFPIVVNSFTVMDFLTLIDFSNEIITSTVKDFTPVMHIDTDLLSHCDVLPHDDG